MYDLEGTILCVGSLFILTCTCLLMIFELILGTLSKTGEGESTTQIGGLNSESATTLIAAPAASKDKTSRYINFLKSTPEPKGANMPFQRRSSVFLKDGRLECEDENGKKSMVDVKNLTQGVLIHTRGGVHSWVFGGKKYVLIGGNLTSRPMVRTDYEEDRTRRTADAALIYPISVINPHKEMVSVETQTDVCDVRAEVTIPVVKPKRFGFLTICFIVICLSLVLTSARAENGTDSYGFDVSDWVEKHNPIKLSPETMDQIRMNLKQAAAIAIWLLLWTPLPAVMSGLVLLSRANTWMQAASGGILHLTLALTARFTVIPACLSAAMTPFWGVACSVVWVLCVNLENCYVAGLMVLACWVWKVAIELQIRPICDPVTGTPMSATMVLRTNAESAVLVIIGGCLSAALHNGSFETFAPVILVSAMYFCYVLPSEEMIITQMRNGRPVTTRVVPKIQSKNGLWFKLRAKMAATRTSESMWDNCFRVTSGIYTSCGFQYRGMMWVLNHGIEEGKTVSFQGNTKFRPNRRKPEEVVLEHDKTTGFGVDGPNIVRQPKLASTLTDGWKTMIHFDANDQKCASVFYGTWRDGSLTGLTQALNGDSGAPVYNEDGLLEAIYMGGGTGVGVFSSALPLKLRPPAEVEVEEENEPVPEVVEELVEPPPMQIREEPVAFVAHSLSGTSEELTVTQDLRLQMEVMMNMMRNLTTRMTLLEGGEPDFSEHKKKGKTKGRSQESRRARSKRQEHYRAYPRQNQPMFQEQEYAEMREAGVPEETIRAAAKLRWIDHCNKEGKYEECEREAPEDSGDESDESTTYQRHSRVCVYDESDFHFDGTTAALDLVRKSGAVTAIEHDDGRYEEHVNFIPSRHLSDNRALSAFQKRNSELAEQVEDLVAENEVKDSVINSLEGLAKNLQGEIQTRENNERRLVSLVQEREEELEDMSRKMRSLEAHLQQQVEKPKSDAGCMTETPIDDMEGMTTVKNKRRNKKKNQDPEKVVLDFSMHASKRVPVTMACGAVTTVPSGHYKHAKNNNSCVCASEPKCPLGVPFETPCGRHCNHWWCATQTNVECNRKNCANLYCVEKRAGIQDMTSKESGVVGGPAAAPLIVSS